MAELEGKTQCKNGCGKEIGFHPKWVAKGSGAKVPIEVGTDGKWKRHDCPKKPAQGASDSALGAVVQAHEARIKALEDRLSEAGF